MIKKILGSKILKLLFSATLLYLAFRKVDIAPLLVDLSQVPVWFVVAILLYSFFVMGLGSARWALLLLGKVSFNDILFFSKVNMIGGFYSLFLSSSLGGDMFKWIHLGKKYNKLTKSELVSSMVIDRVVGLSAFAVVAFLMMILGKITGFDFPDFLFWFFMALVFGIAVFYGLVFWLDFDKYFSKYRLFHKVIKVFVVLKKGNKKRIAIAFLISLLGQILWTLPIWFYSLIFNAGMSLLSIYVLVPIINLILVLPISVVGFGAREQLFIYFFAPLGIAEEKILLVSTFGGVLGVVSALLGGLLTLL